MAENQSPNLQLDDLSPEDNGLSKVEDKPAEENFEILGSDVDEESALQTPEQKFGSQKFETPNYTSETFLSSVSGSTDIYTKEGSEVAWSSPSSSDAESGTYDLPKKNFLQHVNGDETLQPKVIDLEFNSNGVEENHHVAIEEGDEDMLQEKEALYEELHKKVAKYEAELKLTKEKLESSQEEISNLKYENSTLVGELGGAIEKIRISEKNTAEMEKKLRTESEEHRKQFQVQLDLANQNIDLLQAELVSERRMVSELQETINKTTNDLNTSSREVEKLKLALYDAQQDLSKDRSQFQHDIACLNEQKDALESRNRLLEEQIKQYEAEKIESGRLQEALESDMLDEIRKLKDEAFAKIQNLVTELNVRDTNMLQMEEQISKLAAEHTKLIDESEKTQKLLEEFKLKISDQEKELEKQRQLISDRAEEKREAIRQLCFSLEYYRNGYQELCQAFKHKHPAVLAA